MYDYEFIKNDTFCSIYKKHCNKVFFTSVLTFLSIVNIGFAIVLWYFICALSKLNYIFLIFSLFILITFQIIFAINSHRKIVAKSLNNFRNSPLQISFNDNGIKISNESMVKEVKWNGIKYIELSEDYFIISYKILSISNNIFIFQGFNVPKDIIISEIEKYIQVRRIK